MTTKPSTYTRPLNTDEAAALQAFADQHGKKWRDTLSMTYWYNARLWRGANGNDDEVGTVLHGIRNNRGPSWLYSYCDINPASKR